METILTIGVMTAAVAAGVAIAVVSSRKKKKTAPVDWRKEQLLVDAFGAAQAKSWFVETCNGDTSGKQMLVAFLTEQIQKQLEISGEKLDWEHYLILSVLENDQPIQYRLVNFVCLEESFLRMLQEHGGKLLIKG